jgi:hypothetical protein
LEDEKMNYAAPPGRAYAYEVNSPEAQESQELHAILRDLDFVMATLEYLAELLREGPPPLTAEQWNTGVSSSGASPQRDVVIRSLWTTALVTYVRCYASGTRYSLQVQDLTEEYPQGNLAELHDYFKNLRDKHVAHSVSPLETFGTGVKLVQEADGRLRVADLATAHATYGHPTDAESVETFRTFVWYVREVVSKRFRDAKRRAREKAETLSQEQLRSLQPLELRPGLDPGLVRPPRPRPGPSQEQ